METKRIENQNDTSFQKKGLRLTFDVFNVENVANRDDCEFDSVRVYDWFVDEKTHGDMLGR